MRIACLLAICIATAGVGTLTASRAADAPRGTPAALIDLGGIFGGDDENEPDENEPEEGGAREQPEDQGASGVSIPVVLVLVALAGAVGGFVYMRIRRLVLRVRAWGRGLWARL
jgi:hypothetical protein